MISGLIYISKRLIGGLVAVFLACTIITTIIFLVPVDPARMTFGQRLESKTLEATRAKYGLDQPLHRQLTYYLRDISPLNFMTDDNPVLEDYRIFGSLTFGGSVMVLKRPYLRRSYQTGRDVWEVIMQALPQTIILAFVAMMIATPLGIMLGVISSRFVSSWVDEGLIALSVLGYSVPSYVSALVFSLVFGYWLGHLTGLPIQGSLFELNDRGEVYWQWHHVILPALALGIRPIAVIMQITRSAMLGELSLNYIVMARAKGLREWVVYIRHAFRNALNPIVTSVSGWFAALIAGSFFVESIFKYNGIGKVTVNALLMFDVPVLIGSIVIVSGLYVLINIATDLCYRWLDVRVELE